MNEKLVLMIDTHKTLFEESSEKYWNDLQSKMQHRRLYEQWVISKRNTLLMNIIKIEDAFKSINFEVTKLNLGGWYNQDLDYNDSHRIVVNVELNMIGRRKPLSDKKSFTMTKSEQQRRRESIVKSQEKFRELTGFGISLNEYSMVRLERILCDLYI